MPEGLAQLPKEPADLFTKPFLRFVRIEAMVGAALLLCAIVALALANSSWSAAYLAFWERPAGLFVGDFAFSRPLQDWINDALMTLFFFLVALELKREIVLGELRNPRRAALPLAGALGGMVVPAALYLLVVDGGAGTSGWGTVMSTDTAFVIGCLAVLGRRVPESLRLFLLALAIFDDIGAILVVAVGYGHAPDWTLLAVAGLGLASVAGIARLGVRSIPVYFAIGICIWLVFDAAGVHATLAGVILGLMTPARSWISDNRLRAILDRVSTRPRGAPSSGDAAGRRDLRRAGIAAREAVSPIERLEHGLHPWVAFAIMPLFALANAGVPIAPAASGEPIALAIFVAFVVGKPIGVVVFTALAVSVGLAARADDISWGMLAGGSALTGIGFTMALFIADLAFPAELLNSVKLGVLAASATSALLGMLALALLTRVGRAPAPVRAAG